MHRVRARSAVPVVTLLVRVLLRCSSAGLVLVLALSARAAQSLYFGDPGGTVEVAGSVVPADLTQWTIECRFKVLAPGTQAVHLVSQWNDNVDKANPDPGRFHIGLNSSGQVVVGLRTAKGGTYTVVAYNSGYKKDALWHHLAVTCNQGALVILVDGKVATKETCANATKLAPTQLPFIIGPRQSRKDAPPVFFEGFISDVAVWNIARDPGAIEQGLKQPLTGTEPGLVACFPLHEETAAATVNGLPSGVPAGQLSAGLAAAGWCDTPSWNDPKPNRPWMDMFHFDLSTSPPAAAGQTEAPPAMPGDVRRYLVMNDQTQQVGVLWQEPSSRRVYITWVNPGMTGVNCTPLPVLENANLTAGTWAPGGCLYYFMVEQLPMDRPAGTVLKGTMRLVRPDGKTIRELAVDMGPNAFNFANSNGGDRGSMAYGKGFLAIIQPREMFGGHQAAMAATFPADLSKTQLLGNASSHSFGNVMTTNSLGECIGIDLGDNFPRGVHLHKFTASRKASQVIFTYKTLHAYFAGNNKDPYPEISPPGHTLYKWSNDNGTYTELGGVVEGDKSYSVVFATDQTPEGKVLDNLRIFVNNEARNLAMLRIVKNFDRVSSGGTVVSDALMVPGDPPGSKPETGGYYDFVGNWTAQRVTGVVWLTNYGLGEAAHAPHLIRRHDGSILIVWEKTGPEGPSLWAMVVHESGRKIVEPVQLAMDLILDRQDPIVRVGNHLYLLARQREGNGPVLCWFIDH